MKNIFKLFKQKPAEIKKKPWEDPDISNRIESIKKYWTPELIEWMGNETNPVILATAACLLNTWIYPPFMPSNPGDYMRADENNPVLSYFISDLMKMLAKKSELICPGLYHKIWISNYYNKYRS
jgi:hypothetical protein